MMIVPIVEMREIMEIKFNIPIDLENGGHIRKDTIFDIYGANEEGVTLVNKDDGTNDYIYILLPIFNHFLWAGLIEKIEPVEVAEKDLPVEYTDPILSRLIDLGYANQLQITVKRDYR